MNDYATIIEVSDDESVLRIPKRTPLVLICWGDESVTTYTDERHPEATHLNDLQRKLFATRLRAIADGLDPGDA